MTRTPGRATKLAIFAGICGLYTSIHANRQMPAILAESVRSSLQLGDASLGALSGTAFSIVYALLGLHFGRQADFRNRLSMVCVGGLVWSVASVLAALATSYGALLAARAGVAAGEAIATSASISLIAELAGERLRARAYSLLSACAFVGAGLAALAGGPIVEHVRLLGLDGWRAAFALAGIPGVALSLYLYRYRTLFEPETPARGRSGGGTALVLGCASALAVIAQVSLPSQAGVPLALIIALGAAVTWAYNLRRDDPDAFQSSLGQPLFVWLLAGFSALVFADFAASFWLIPFALRQYGISATVAGTGMGALTIAGGVGGSVLAGFAADRWRLRAVAGRVWTALVCAVLEAAAILLSLAQSTYTGFVCAFAVFCIASGGWTGVTAAIGMEIISPRHRGSGVAAYFLATTLCGAGLGVWFAGLLAEERGSLRLALSLCCVLVAVSLFAFAKLGRGIARASSQAPKRECRALPGAL